MVVTRSESWHDPQVGSDVVEPAYEVVDG